MGRVVEDEALWDEALALVCDRRRRQGAHGGGIDGDGAGLGGRVHLLAGDVSVEAIPTSLGQHVPRMELEGLKVLAVRHDDGALFCGMGAFNGSRGACSRLGRRGAAQRGWMRRWDETEGPWGTLPVPVPLLDTYTARLV